MNKIIKNTLILAAITVVSGLVLGAAYEVTKGPIAQTQAKQKQEACQAVYPEADSFEAMDVDQKAAKEAIKKMGTNATVDEVYSAVMDGSEAGYVISLLPHPLPGIRRRKACTVQRPRQRAGGEKEQARRQDGRDEGVRPHSRA